MFVGQAAKGRICYVLAQPKTREPASLKRDPGYAFISDRPAEGVRNEVSFIMGFDVAGGADDWRRRPTSNPTRSPDEDERRRTKTEAKAESKASRSPRPVATVGEETFDLLPKGANLWVKNAARESALIAEMKKGGSSRSRPPRVKGNASTDSYSLSGFSQAMDRLQKECPAKS